jgi:carbonic anhydrase
MLTFSNDELRSKLAADAGADASHIDFLPFGDLDSVRDDVQRIRESPFLPADILVTGYVYDVDTGGLTPVETAAV